MDLLALVITVSLNGFLGLFVLLRNTKSATNRIFFLLTLDIICWSFANYFSLHTLSGISVLFWMRLVMFFAVPQAVLFLLLIETFPNTKIVIPKKYFISLVSITLITMALAMSPFLFVGLNTTTAVPAPIPGPAMPLFILVTIGSLMAGVIRLIQKFLKAKGTLKSQYKFLFLGLVSMFLLILILNFLTVVLFQNVQFIGLSPLFTLPFIISIAYSIIKHRFLDITYLLVRTVSYLILIVILALLFSTIIFFISQILFDIQLSITQQFILIAITVLITLSFPLLERSISKFTNKIFYKLSYNPDVVLSKINEITTESLDLYTLSSQILSELISEIKITKSAFVFFQFKGDPLLIEKGYQLNHQIVIPEIDKLSMQKQTIFFEDEEEGTIKDWMRELDISIILFLQTKHKKIGLLLLGPKSSGAMYSERDSNFLKLMIPELSIAIQNAQAIEEIKQFNITLQEKIETATKEIRDTNQKLQDLDKLKDEFVSLASHELRTPMSAIKGSLSTILEGYAGDISDETREFLSAAYNENDRLIRLVNNLLNTSRIESGKLSFTLSEVNMSNLIQEVVKNMQIAVKEKNIFLRHESTGIIPPITADEDKIKEVIINLIGNAIKFTSHGGITVATEVVDNMIQISVKDTGTGIHKNDFDLLFKKFSQVKSDQKYTKSYGGTGLGLYLSQKIIEGHGGKIWLDSDVGKGTTFYFTLPIAKK